MGVAPKPLVERLVGLVQELIASRGGLPVTEGFVAGALGNELGEIQDLVRARTLYHVLSAVLTQPQLAADLKTALAILEHSAWSFEAEARFDRLKRFAAFVEGYA